MKVLSARVEADSPGELRELMDDLKVRIKSGVIVLASEASGKAMLICGVTDDLTGRFDAGNIIGRLAEKVGGRGGGRTDMAQAGGSDPTGINDAVEMEYRVVEEG